MKSIKKKSVVLIVVCLLCAVLCAMAEHPLYRFDDLVSKLTVEHAVQKAFQPVRDGGLLEIEQRKTYYDMVKDFMCEYVGYDDAILSGEITQLYDELNARDRITQIPKKYATQSQLTRWLSKNAKAGDILFYKVNGRIAHGMVYAGSGNALWPRYRKQSALAPITAIIGEGLDKQGDRQESTGLCAVGRLDAKEPETVKKDIGPVLCFRSDGYESENMEGGFYRLYEWSEAKGKYLPMRKCSVYERSPGLYCLWNGADEHFELTQDNNGSILLVDGLSRDIIPWQMRYQITDEQAAGSKAEFIIPQH